MAQRFHDNKMQTTGVQVAGVAVVRSFIARRSLVLYLSCTRVY